MKRYFALLISILILFTFASCTENVTPNSDDENDVTHDTIFADTTENTDSDVELSTDEQDNTDLNEQEPVSANISEQSYTLPSLDTHTLVANPTNNKAGFKFSGETKQTKTCHKMIMVNDEGITQLSVSFADDGSGLTVFTLDPNGDKFSTLAQFDRNGNLVGIFNGSGAYSDYYYDNNTCILKAYDNNNNLIDYRKYYYDDNEITQKVEVGDGKVVQEVYNYTNDSSGKVTTLRVENKTGYILYSYSYNAEGHVSSRRIEQNNMFYGIQQYTYDEHGKRLTYTFRNVENETHPSDMTVNYYNVYDTDGTYLGTSEVDPETGKVYISVVYDYITTDYPHYAEFIETHFMNY